MICDTSPSERRSGINVAGDFESTLHRDNRHTPGAAAPAFTDVNPGLRIMPSTMFEPPKAFAV